MPQTLWDVTKPLMVTMVLCSLWQFPPLSTSFELRWKDVEDADPASIYHTNVRANKKRKNPFAHSGLHTCYKDKSHYFEDIYIVHDQNALCSCLID